MSDTKTKTPDILIIDDNESDAKLMEEAIKDTIMTNSTHVLNEASDALNFLNKKDMYKNAPTPDLILVDLKMPNFDGHDFLRIVKEDPQFKHIPVVILSASNDPEDIKESYRLHANCYIIKPQNFMRFKKVISIINEFWLGIATLPPKA